MPFVVAWPLLTGLLLFVLGTYERIAIVRDARGRVEISKVWRFGFVKLQPTVEAVRGFEGVVTSQNQDTGPLEWFVFLVLICSGGVPALIWWYCVIHKPTFHVALAQDHGRAEFFVYRGKSERQMEEIRDLLTNAAGLRLLA